MDIHEFVIFFLLKNNQFGVFILACNYRQNVQLILLHVYVVVKNYIPLSLNPTYSLIKNN